MQEVVSFIAVVGGSGVVKWWRLQLGVINGDGGLANVDEALEESL